MYSIDVNYRNTWERLSLVCSFVILHFLKMDYGLIVGYSHIC